MAVLAIPGITCSANHCRLWHYIYYSAKFCSVTLYYIIVPFFWIGASGMPVSTIGILALSYCWRRHIDLPAVHMPRNSHLSPVGTSGHLAVAQVQRKHFCLWRQAQDWQKALSSASQWEAVLYVNRSVRGQSVVVALGRSFFLRALSPQWSLRQLAWNLISAARSSLRAWAL